MKLWSRPGCACSEGGPPPLARTEADWAAPPLTVMGRPLPITVTHSPPPAVLSEASHCSSSSSSSSSSSAAAAATTEYHTLQDQLQQLLTQQKDSQPSRLHDDFCSRLRGVWFTPVDDGFVLVGELPRTSTLPASLSPQHGR